MKSVSSKTSTLRRATAVATVVASPDTIARMQTNDLPKKDVLVVARVAGVTAAKKTPDIIPYCHPLPIDWVEVEFEVHERRIEIEAHVEATWKTGVEMEALTAATAAALTIYDMLKPVEPAIEITTVKLLEKRGGKSDFFRRVPKGYQAAVIVTSDSTHEGTREDRSGKILRERLESYGIKPDYVVLPDEKDAIVESLRGFVEKGADLVLTTGGTGLGSRDVTVEATRSVIEQEVPGVMEDQHARIVTRSRGDDERDFPGDPSRPCHVAGKGSRVTSEDRMISPAEAQALIAGHCSVLGTETVALRDALGRVLTEDVRSPIALPSFDNSVMDGFAFRSRDTLDATASSPARLAVVDRVFAGDTAKRSLRRGEACVIMTGAALPRGADSVLPQELAVTDGTVLIIDSPLARGRHVRRRGEEITKGAVVLVRGACINPGTIACLATMGKARVRVRRRPVVSVITTGDETVAPGRALAHGQIYDSNSFMIAAALREMDIEPRRIVRVGDRAAALTNAVAAALAQSDVLVVSGGVSVGERDHLRAVLARQRVKEIFWRVSQKPGKPLYFGAKGKRAVFGLPGNPASTFTCFYLYVYPALRRMGGFPSTTLPRRERITIGAVDADARRWRFLKAHIDADATAQVLPRQGSHMITSLAHTNGLVVVPPAQKQKKGDRVETYTLPFAEEDGR
jgi:molybdopterin molybdotransferase